MRDAVIYRFIKLRCKRGWVSGISICKQLSIPLQQLKALDNIGGIGSIGPCADGPMKRLESWMRYAKYNSYHADFRYFFRYRGRLYCFKERPFRKGIWTKPRTKRTYREDKPSL